MFTGIVHGRGLVRSVEPGSGATRFEIEPSGLEQTPARGASIAIDGCCLTVAEAPAGGVLAFDAIPETLARTTLGRLRAGDSVNLEPAARADTPLDGHVVQGHVEGVARVSAVLREGDGGWRVRFDPPAELMACIVPKGSVTVAGVSLTIAAVEPGSGTGEGGWFEVALIPTTLELTTLGALEVGAEVNIETDILARTVAHWMRHYAGE